MSTITSICRELTALLLLLAVLMLPLNSVARDLSPSATKDSCACQSLFNEPAADANQEQTAPCPGSNTGDCCDSQERGSDAAAAPLLGASRTTISDRQLFHPSAAGFTPEVYLAIVVPPES